MKMKFYQWVTLLLAHKDGNTISQLASKTDLTYPFVCTQIGMLSDNKLLSLAVK